ncbi:hypothetical protein BN12_10088 [Nostocoides japonicum T1-X7]|uniref:Uncharacterized protein n=1 Tax=Nostocoides japonicum T1-X7 TaxID=1194083 RepID=A0A077LSV1_9MICO|nr:hypothetical protein BN12_10088 [Tetrasphaera japonica T1-X7]
MLCVNGLLSKGGDARPVTGIGSANRRGSRLAGGYCAVVRQGQGEIWGIKHLAGETLSGAWSK